VQHICGHMVATVAQYSVTFVLTKVSWPGHGIRRKTTSWCTHGQQYKIQEERLHCGPDLEAAWHGTTLKIKCIPEKCNIVIIFQPNVFKRLRNSCVFTNILGTCEN